MQELIYEIARQREQDLQRHVNKAAPAREVAPARIVIRYAADCDHAALSRLAALEGADLLPGSWLLALADGSLTAALHLDDGAVLADPFVRTKALRRLLEVWAAQLTGQRRRRRWHLAM